MRGGGPPILGIKSKCPYAIPWNGTSSQPKMADLI